MKSRETNFDAYLMENEADQAGQLKPRYDYIEDRANRMKLGGYQEPRINEMRAFEEKKQSQRENRLKRIVSGLEIVLKEFNPDDDQRFAITFEQINEHGNNVLAPGESFEIPFSSLPAYSIFLVDNFNRENRFEIMYLQKEDLDRRVKVDNIETEYRIEGFSGRVSQGIEQLKSVSGK